MCTVTFCPRKSGYALAMNRDELLARPPGLPPAKIKLNGRDVLRPSEPGGGTWIAVNQDRVCFSLINWYAVAVHVQGAAVSRGEIILAVGASATSVSVDELLQKYPLKKTNPFRLIGIFPARNEIVEWQWDLKRLVRKNHRWRMQQWISSGFDEPIAQRKRNKTFRRVLKQLSAGGFDWLRRLHRPHMPESGPFSICMHRADAATVSYTEVAVSAHEIAICYHDGAPCQFPALQAFKYFPALSAGVNVSSATPAITSRVQNASRMSGLEKSFNRSYCRS